MIWCQLVPGQTGVAQVLEKATIHQWPCQAGKERIDRSGGVKNAEN